MEYTEFITHVQSLAQSNSREEAERATHATLGTIKELIPNHEAQEIAAQLPEELGKSLSGKEAEPTQSFHLQEFIERTSHKENIEPTTAAIHVRAVFAVLQNAITPDQFRKFHTYFSHDYEELFATSTTS
ncbi:DUF2267 domain-containing protein [Anabaena cylindrica FACHB-243]|uniref:DUF2267 domain-containing protein n=1 Tax=Anabaena cylindrica (strain ATCC 27899 / PCC 7122) TaxID=272123 RepID=K9ZAW2_ANACC|nr:MULTISPECIES: DUF2267 domain-containing protein [Anabaena]AFZ56338.1 Protein of unknown function DUF2267 [Anabaena cylindrica PCC 7122]MBD2418213.1 DUF2267 domain-containing protein [Anabaena cylindrica FACHB-243]MBY5283938.1 DUF2267 domain-containing protein [Anabaena sp. CCAP 1446/1C]MBY5308040.1 DUF2267 domain-containing protein [Anabaena sp. CCAP 1446/1C]MCM2409065.1 DUF2267 domain-containing protein [Anabaena sp. CCAP 1446/1C]